MSYTCLAYHIVLATRDRRPLILPEMLARLVPYIGGILRELDAQLLEANGPKDHLHLAAILGPTHSVADVARVVKTNSSKWVHRTFPDLPFGWQDGYSAFSVSKSRIPGVLTYVRNQRKHHVKIAFRDEMIALLSAHGIAFDEKYLPA